MFQGRARLPSILPTVSTRRDRLVAEPGRGRSWSTCFGGEGGGGLAWLGSVQPRGRARLHSPRGRCRHAFAEAKDSRQNAVFFFLSSSYSDGV